MRSLTARAPVENVTRDIRQKLPNDVHAGIGCHRDSEAYSTVASGVVVSRLPKAGDERCSRCAANLRNREVSGAVIAAGEDAALNGIFHPPPDPMLSGTVVEVILVQKILTGHLKHVADGRGCVIVRKSAPIPLRALSPLRWDILRLSDSGPRLPP